MSGAEARFRALLSEVQKTAEAIPDALAFARDLPRNSGYVVPRPNQLPVHVGLAGMLAQSGPETRDLAGAVLEVADDAEWQQTYTEAQVGADFLARYGWFNVVSPDGPFLSDRLRVAIAVWGAGLSYPLHRHMPEELYVVIAGGAIFRTEGRGDAWLGPGGTRRHPSGVLHGMELQDTPLVALVFWKGAALMRASVLEP